MRAGAAPSDDPFRARCYPPAVPPSTAVDAPARPPSTALRAVRRPFEQLDPAAWDALAAASPWATPFSSWAFHRAWWDGYGANAHEETLVLVPADGPDDADPVAIIPLMHRHEVEPRDLELHTAIRHGEGLELTPVPADAKALFFGASYHADYATILGAPERMAAAAEAFAEYCAAGGDPEHPQPWDAVDLRRLRTGDPALAALSEAFGRREMEQGWTLNVEPEEVCPVAALPEGASMDEFLGTLGKKERHEIRRKVRRAEAAGEVRLEPSADLLADLPEFIDLHQRRWGDDGLFPDTEGGAQSRRFFERLFELAGGDGPLRLAFLTVGGRRVAACVSFDTGDACLYYNAGVDPDARELSPGVVMVERLVERAVERGARRIDFLRGNEPYKYEWGAADSPIWRLLVRRTVPR